MEGKYSFDTARCKKVKNSSIIIYDGTWFLVGLVGGSSIARFAAIRLNYMSMTEIVALWFVLVMFFFIVGAEVVRILRKNEIRESYLVEKAKLLSEVFGNTWKEKDDEWRQGEMDMFVFLLCKVICSENNKITYDPKLKEVRVNNKHLLKYNAKRDVWKLETV